MFFSSITGTGKILVPAQVVSKSAEPYALIQAVVTFVNRMRDEGMYRADEMPKTAVPAYNADYYYAQVCNGGHAQFLHNSRMDTTTLLMAEEGLRKAGLKALRTCLAGLVDKREAADMKALDEAFFAAYGDYHAKMNAWLKSSIRALPDDKYDAGMSKLLARDQARQQRFVDIKALKMQAQLESPLDAAVALAARKIGEEPSAFLPSRFMTFMGQTLPAIRIQLASGEIKWGMFHESFALLPEEPPSDVSSEDEAEQIMDAAIVVSEDEIEASVALSRSTKAGILAALFLSEVIDLEDVTRIFLNGAHENMLVYEIKTKSHGAFQFICGQNNGALLGQDGKDVGGGDAKTVQSLLAKHAHRIGLAS